MERLQIHIDFNQDVFVMWGDGKASGTLTLTPAEAMAIGDVGKMAELRKEAENDKGSNNRIS